LKDNITIFSLRNILIAERECDGEGSTWEKFPRLTRRWVLLDVSTLDKAGGVSGAEQQRKLQSGPSADDAACHYDAINAKLKPDLTHKESTSTVQNPKIWYDNNVCSNALSPCGDGIVFFFWEGQYTAPGYEAGYLTAKWPLSRTSYRFDRISDRVWQGIAPLEDKVNTPFLVHILLVIYGSCGELKAVWKCDMKKC